MCLGIVFNRNSRPRSRVAHREPNVRPIRYFHHFRACGDRPGRCGRSCFAAGGGGGGGGGTKVFGKGDSKLKPFCQKGREYGTCLVVGSLTTFINKLGEKKHPFVAPKDGRIVAWSIELGHKPSHRSPKGNPEGKSNLEFFQDLFGSQKYGKGPVARLAILKRQGSGVEFKLVDQSPTEKLSGPFYNKDTVITLERPLPIKKGEIVGLSSMTWIPMLKPHKRGDGKSALANELEEGRLQRPGHHRRQSAEEGGLNPRVRLPILRPPLLQGLVRPELGRPAERFRACRSTGSRRHRRRSSARSVSRA